MKHLFGPVQSRRLGLSLGVDLVPWKTCPLDCVYCECGATNHFELVPAEYISLEEVKEELRNYLDQKPELDYVTFSGSGEPTLHSGIGEVILFIKQNYPEYKVAVLTNGVLFTDPEVRKRIMAADLVVPSLDAVSRDVFFSVNRPAAGLDPERIIDGLCSFRKEFDGAIILEIFIVPGINDTKQELALIKDAALRINPDAVQLNSLDRPGAVSWVRPVDVAELEKIREFMSPLNVQIIKRPVYHPGGKPDGDVVQAILNHLQRRPATITDLSYSIGIHEKGLREVLAALEKEGKIITQHMDRGVFYSTRVS